MGFNIYIERNIDIKTVIFKSYQGNKSKEQSKELFQTEEDRWQLKATQDCELCFFPHKQQFWDDFWNMNEL